VRIVRRTNENEAERKSGKENWNESSVRRDAVTIRRRVKRCASGTFSVFN